MLNALQFQWKVNKCMNFESIMAQFPKFLQKSIKLHIHSDFIESVPFFRNVSLAFVRAVVERLRSLLCLEGEYIISQGDAATMMYFLREGSVNIIASNGKKVVATLEAGSYFGEIGLLLHHGRRMASVRAGTSCQLFVLHKKDLDWVLERFTECRAALTSAAVDRLRKVQAATSRSKWKKAAKHVKTILAMGAGTVNSIQQNDTVLEQLTLHVVELQNPPIYKDAKNGSSMRIEARIGDQVLSTQNVDPRAVDSGLSEEEGSRTNHKPYTISENSSSQRLMLSFGDRGIEFQYTSSKGKAGSMVLKCQVMQSVCREGSQNEEEIAVASIEINLRSINVNREVDQFFALELLQPESEYASNTDDEPFLHVTIYRRIMPQQNFLFNGKAGEAKAGSEDGKGRESDDGSPKAGKISFMNRLRGSIMELNGEGMQTMEENDDLIAQPLHELSGRRRSSKSNSSIGSSSHDEDVSQTTNDFTTALMSKLEEIQKTQELQMKEIQQLKERTK